MKFFLSAIIAVISLLCWLVFYSPGKQPLEGKQVIYSYQSENIGYSDIERLYSSDTADHGRPFFKRKSLQTIHVSFNCEIKKTILRQNATTFFACFQVLDPALVIENGNFPVNTTLLSQELTHPVFAEISKTGLIRVVRTDTAISNLAGNIVKEMLSRMQFVMPPKVKASWQVPEENTSGTFLAKYHYLTKDKTGARYQKSNLGYIKLRSLKKDQRIIADNKTTITTDSSGEMKYIETSEAQFVLFHSDTITAAGSNVKILLKSVSKTAIEELDELAALNLSGNYTDPTTLSSGLSDDKINRMAYTNTLGGDTWEILCQKLQTAVIHSDTLREDSLVLKFRALAYLYPGTCEKIYKILKTETHASLTFRVLSHALAGTETPAAINALISVIRERKKEDDLLIDLLPVLATTATPTTEAVNLVKQMAFDTTASEAILSTSQLTLGGLAYNLRKLDAGASEQICRFILEKMATQKDTMQKVLVLGNTGSAMVLPVLKAYISNPHVSNQIRAASIIAIRLVDSKEVPELLKALLKNKSSLLVNAARETIAFRKEYFGNSKH